MLPTTLHIALDFFRLFYPKNCAGCQTALVKNEAYICLKCLLDLPYTHFEKLKDNPAEKLFYGRVNIEFAAAILFFSKHESVQHILHHIKYGEYKALGEYMGRVMGERIQQDSLYAPIDLIIPVPLHPRKEHIRGYNQSKLLADGISEILKIPLADKHLIRNIHTDTQTKKSRIERWENVEHAFEVRKPNQLNDKHILLVDDVLTTGATLEACAQTLLKSETCKISIITLAMAH